jgi:hypothetical protein
MDVMELFCWERYEKPAVVVQLDDLPAAELLERLY